MGHNTFGTEFSITTFGESHGAAIGVVIDGVEAGFPIDLEALQADMDRRRPGGNKLGTPRDEADTVQILSGVFQGKTTGTPICMLVWNTNQISSAYDELKGLYRPGHADYTYQMKYGIRDWRGGGRASARETAARVAAGALARQLLAKRGITVKAGTVQVGAVKASERDWSIARTNLLSCPDSMAAGKMQEAIEQARGMGDSVGGVVECVVQGCPAGLGDPQFDKLEAKLGQAMLSINATRGVEFGDGFAASERRGSENNDPYRMVDGKVKPVTNHAGGILGGLSTGEPITFRVAIKPTSSIAIEQDSVNLQTGENACLRVHGRHDPCIVPRAVPCVEAAAAIAVYDALLVAERRGV